MIDIKAVKEVNKLRIYAKIPGHVPPGTQQKEVKVKENDGTEKTHIVDDLMNAYDDAFCNFRGFYQHFRGPGDASFDQNGSFEKVFESYVNLGGTFDLNFAGFLNTKELISFKEGSFGMGAINVLSTIGNYMPTLDAPLMSTYTGMSPLKFSADCYLNLEEWKESHADLLNEGIGQGLTTQQIVNYCYNYPIMRLMFLILPYRFGKFGKAVDDLIQGYNDMQKIIANSYGPEKDENGNPVFNADECLNQLQVLSQKESQKDNTALAKITDPKDRAQFKTESDIRTALANPANYVTPKDASEGLFEISSSGYLYNLGLAFGEMTDTEHGSDNVLIKIAKYIGQAGFWVLEEGKAALDTFVGDMYYLKPPFPFAKLATSDQRGFTVFLGSKRFDEVFITGIDIGIPSGYYEGGVPSSINIKIHFMMRRQPTVDLVHNLLLKNDPLHWDTKKGFGRGYDDVLASKPKEALGDLLLIDQSSGLTRKQQQELEDLQAIWDEDIEEEDEDLDSAEMTPWSSGAGGSVEPVDLGDISDLLG